MKIIINKSTHILGYVSRNKKGFTLIEMLVVFLIIGILAGVALPQYQKTVEKTHFAEALLNISSIQKSIDMYLLSNGYPSSGSVHFLREDNDAELELDIIQNMECGEYVCHTEKFCYGATCTKDECSILITPVHSQEPLCGQGDNSYELDVWKEKDGEEWNKKCLYSSSKEHICKYLESLGFEREAGC